MTGIIQKQPFTLKGQTWNPCKSPVPPLHATQASQERPGTVVVGGSDGWGGWSCLTVTFVTTTCGTPTLEFATEWPRAFSREPRTTHKAFLLNTRCSSHALQKFVLSLTKEMSVFNSTHPHGADRHQRQRFDLVSVAKGEDTQQTPLSRTAQSTHLSVSIMPPKFISHLTYQFFSHLSTEDPLASERWKPTSLREHTL